MADEPRLFLAIYTDEDLTGKLAPALRERGFDSQCTAEAGMLNASDEAQLAYATSRGMVLLTSNAAHFASLAKQYAETGNLIPALSCRPSSMAGGVLASCYAQSCDC